VISTPTEAILLQPGKSKLLSSVLDSIQVAGRSRKNPFGTWVSIHDDAVPGSVAEMIIDQLCETEATNGVVYGEGSIWIWKR
jgi:hypothetical protein